MYVFDCIATVATPYSNSNTFKIDLISHKSDGLVSKIRNAVQTGNLSYVSLWAVKTKWLLHSRDVTHSMCFLFDILFILCSMVIRLLPALERI